MSLKIHEKDSLQILSKFEESILEECEHIFTLLNTDEEYKKGPDAQLTTTKLIIKAYCGIYFAAEKGTNKEKGPVMRMIVWNE